MQAAEEQCPPDGREGSNPLNRVFVAEVREGIGPEPVLALLCPVVADNTALGRIDLGLELLALGGHDG